MLPDIGRVSREEADRKAHEEYAVFEQRRRAALEAQGEAELAGQLDELAAKAKQLEQEQKAKPKRAQ